MNAKVINEHPSTTTSGCHQIISISVFQKLASMFYCHQIFLVSCSDLCQFGIVNGGILLLTLKVFSSNCQMQSLKHQTFIFRAGLRYLGHNVMFAIWYPLPSLFSQFSANRLLLFCAHLHLFGHILCPSFDSVIIFQLQLSVGSQSTTFTLLSCNHFQI